MAKRRITTTKSSQRSPLTRTRVTASRGAKCRWDRLKSGIVDKCLFYVCSGLLK